MCGIFGQTVKMGQDKGPAVELVIFGDESYGRHETTDGYTVVYDQDLGLFCYALLAEGRFLSSGRPIDAGPPAGTRRHLKESEAVRNAIFRRRFALLSPPPDGLETFGPNRGLLEGRSVSKGHVRGLTVIVEFADVKAAVTVAQVRAMCNDPGYSANGNLGSVRDYFLKMSSGALDYTNDVVGPIKLKQKRAFYQNTLLVKEAMDALVATGINLSVYDSKHEGTIDAINFLYAGPSMYLGNLWPHNSFLNLQYGAVSTNFYLLTGLGETAADLAIGTMCHENGHLLCRFPDMYDYGERDGDFEKSAGIAYYCLMGAGNHLNEGRTPAPVCGYLRELAGWCTRTVELNQGGRFEAKHGDYATVMKYKTSVPNEYFIVENRAQLEHDGHLPSSGLAVYHCDFLGSNEWQGGTATKHYQCGLVQADGKLDLETNRNMGDAGDLFGAVAGVAFSHATLPAANQWDGSDSGLILSQIGAPGPVISFVVGAGAPVVPTPPGTTLRAAATPGLLIPDANPTGITSTLSMGQSATIRDLHVELDITHPYVGDLLVELLGPSGQRAVLHNRAGGNAANLKKTFDTISAPGLAAFAGLDLRGDWLLRVSDLDARDEGRLNAWALVFEVDAATSQTASGSASPGASIPDANPQGVSSTITLAEVGTVREIKVSLAITHSYIGDLIVKLVSPSGASAVLHNRTGGSADDLKATYDAVSSPALAALVGQPLHGGWTLSVADLDKVDVGTLKQWDLSIVYAPAQHEAGPEESRAAS